MTALFENLWRHVSRCTAGCSQDVKLLFIHNAGESKVGNQQVCVVLWSTEEKVFWFQVSMYNAVIVQIRDSR